MSTSIDIKLSAGDLAKFLGVSPNTITNWRKKKYLSAPRRVSYYSLYSLSQVRRDVEANGLPVTLATADGEWPHGT